MEEQRYKPKRSGQAWIIKGDDIDWKLHYFFKRAATDDVPNDIAMQIIKRSILITEWFLDRGKEEQDTLRFLICQTSPFIDIDDKGKPYLVLNMNDFFYPAADAEPVPESEYGNLASLIRRFPEHGETAWASSRRGGIASRKNREGWDEALAAAMALQKGEAQK